ncbi:MAG: hypothetical protein ISR85_03850 [Kiritimatiellales bacterium]|nr:hypothetical protein [Kiritimatiellota bacterium]MBL7012046.1 hypothetical protein [Kiritimatiellales bacterium]
MKLLIIAVLAAIFSSGCVSQNAIDAAIDQKIAANNVAFVQPMMAQQNLQISSVGAEVAQNRQAISKSSAQMAVHQNVLVDHYVKQRQQATAALEVLTPEPVYAAPAAPVTEETISAPASAAEAVPEPVVSATSD